MGKYARFILIALCAVFLTACGKEEVKTFDFTADQFEQKLKKKLGENFDTTKKITTDNGDYAIGLTDYMRAYIGMDKETNKIKFVSIIEKSDGYLLENKEMKTAFFALLSTVDESLSTAQQYAIFDKLGFNEPSVNLLDHDGAFELNNIEYVYKGSIEDDTLTLQASPK